MFTFNRERISSAIVKIDGTDWALGLFSDKILIEEKYKDIIG